MDCQSWRQAISARIDGEEGAHHSSALDAHLARCASCRTWSEAAVRVTRIARVGPVEDVPDLTAPIMAALSARTAIPLRSRRTGGSHAALAGRAEQAGRPGGSQPAPAAGVARLGLLMVALAQLAIAVPALLGDDAGAPIHVAHEQGSWALALAVGMLVAAWQPSRASALLPILAALVAGLALTMTLDIWAGRTQAAGEAPHGLAFLGLGLLWLLAHTPGGSRPRRHPARPA